MDHGHLSMVADKFQWVFSAPLLNAWGTEAKLCRRQRIVTPFRLGLALTATCASQRVETVADCQRGCKALWDTTSTYKAFSNHVAKPRFADCARAMTSRLIGAITRKVLGLAKGRACAECRPILIQDGSAFAIHDGLREVCPGRGKVVKPAAVELPTTLDWLCAAPTTVVLTPDPTNAQAFLPAPASLRASVLLADRGYLDRPSRRRVQDAGGFLLIRAKAGMNPPGLDALRADGKRLRSLRNKPLKAIQAQRPKRQRVARVVQWHVDECPLCLRLLISWNRQTKACCSLLTTLASRRYPLDTLCRAYQWRWHVELLFQEWQSYANLHALDTAHRALVEGWMWAAMAAAALKRFLAHMPPLLVAGPMSTRKMAMWAMYVFGDLVEALKTGDSAGRYAALEAALTALAWHAQRAHPARDQQTGRSPLGLAPCFENEDMIEFAEAP